MYLSIIILAIIQGVAEFLPISSSAHLIIFRDLFGIGSTVITKDISLTFDIALHFGTLLAILVFFFKDFLNMVVKGLTKGPKHKEGKLLWYIIAATVPAAIFGVAFEETFEEMFRSNFILIGSALIVMGIIINICDKKSKEEKTIGSMTLKDSIIIGCSQVLALIPGFSRSGTTISAARTLKLTKEDAAKFSFFLSAPVIGGACVLSILKGDIKVISGNALIFIIGILVSFVIGLLCIKFLLNYIKKHDFEIFMWYRILIGIIVIVYTILK